MLFRSALFVLVMSLTGFGRDKTTGKQLKITIPENLDYEGLFDDLFEKYAVRWELCKVKTTNMGTLFELNYEMDMKNDAESKAFLDELRCRNGNLNISLCRAEDREML